MGDKDPKKGDTLQDPRENPGLVDDLKDMVNNTKVTETAEVKAAKSEDAAVVKARAMLSEDPKMTARQAAYMILSSKAGVMTADPFTVQQLVDKIQAESDDTSTTATAGESPRIQALNELASDAGVVTAGQDEVQDKENEIAARREDSDPPAA